LTNLTGRNPDNEPEWYQWVLTRIPMGRLGQPEDLVGACLFLASDDSLYVTGATIVVDGGYTAR
jgi:NAD(P)-dependent dehydrogenase (short-subunit alcohol dehydrogenase family)